MSLPSQDAISSEDKDQKVQQIIFVEGSANLLVLIAKAFVGFSTGSLAIIGDAIHSLTDVTNNVVAWSVVKHASKPADKEHPYGHRKFETLAVLGLAVLLLVLAFELVIHAFRRETPEIFSSGWELAIMLFVLIINIVLASWQRMWAKRLDSDILHADASHTFSDVLTTVVVIGGWQLSAMGYVWLDKLCALAIAGFILYLAIQLFKKAAPVLVDEFAIDPELLTKSVAKVEGVYAVSRVRSRWIGNLASVDMIIHVASHLTTEESHKICDEVEIVVEQEFNVTDISIHVEPVKTRPIGIDEANNHSIGVEE
ncbi:cation diffusion facilitator family transporter [Aliikangiella coralliicola]|uniref:Cation transporter n=1 Tax=Aliikangiella coralliicola TaxID=2592383 RepID=A0A545UHS0_9GAMM|nr:cation diffusion facilitator family transporter [Aliikangiella coralliicola]TQV89015.1 cation transporter [Aliikangiella coralliicola]